MTASTRRPLEDYLAFAYPFQVTADEEGGFLVRFPDLPGCFTQVDDVDDIGPMAEEIRTLWIETEYERGADIPLPTYPEEYSGKFNLRLPRSLHRRLTEAATRDGVSLNQYVVMLLSDGVAPKHALTAMDRFESTQHRLEQVLVNLGVQVEEIHAQMTAYRVTSGPRSRTERAQFQVVSGETIDDAVAA